MVNIVRYAEIVELISAVDEHAEALMANEREMYGVLKARYQEPVDGAFDDALCLQLMLRNVSIRKGLGLDPKVGFRQPVELSKTSRDDGSRS